MRDLYIKVGTLRSIEGDKFLIEAVAFAVLIKQHRISSLIMEATHRKLKTEFGIGTERLQRVLANGLSSGFLRKEGGNLIANKLHGDTNLAYCMKAEYFEDAIMSSKHNRLTLNGVIRIIETAILYNHVNMIQDCKDTHSIAHSNDLKAVKRARKRESRMLSSGSYNEGYKGLSNGTITKLIGKKVGTAIKVAKKAIQLNLVSKQWRFDFFDVDGKHVTAYAREYFEFEDMGYIVSLAHRAVYKRLSNEYVIKSENMKYFYSKK